RFYREFIAGAPDQLIVYAGFSTSPEGEPRLGMRAVFNGPIAEGESLLKPLRQFGTPVQDDIKPRTYVDIQKIVEPMFPPGRLNYWKANFVDILSDELIDLWSRLTAEFPRGTRTSQWNRWVAPSRAYLTLTLPSITAHPLTAC